MLPIASCAVLASLNPAGPVHAVVTFTETSTNELNSTVQVKVTVDATGRTGPTGTLVTITDVGDGTEMVEAKIASHSSVHIIIYGSELAT